MKIPLGVVLDQLNAFNHSNELKFSAVTSYKGVQIFESDTVNNDPEYIYINLNNEKIDLCQDIRQITIITNRGCLDDADAAFEKKLTIIEFVENTSMIKLFNHLQKYFNYLFEWDKKMTCHIRNKESLNVLFEESKDLFKNPVIILDLAFNVIVHSKDFPDSNDFLNQILIRGSLDKETIESLVQGKFFRENYRNIAKFEPPNRSNTVHYIKSLFYNNNKMATFVYYCLNGDATQGQLDFIHMFIQYAEELYNWSNSGIVPCISGWDLFIKEIVLNHEISKEEISRYAKLLKLDYSSRYCVGVIKLKETSVRCIKYLINIIRSRNPFYYVSTYDNLIVILYDIKRDKGYEKNIEDRISWLEDFIYKYEGVMGISSTFYCLEDFSNEYKKASVALDLGSKFNKNKCVHKYKDYHIYHMISSVSKDITLDSLCYKKLKKLMDYDMCNNIDNSEILRIYLENDRSVSKTASIKNLHRNSIIYRINQIEDILKIDLDNFNERMRLILTYHAMDVMEHMKKEKLEYAIDGDDIDSQAL
ncbi:MAG: helix-turn-helix domain-containing protein [Sedimentibacter sp.]|uniref:PucR family transcriptional regulator n=1 Tax=Sedimentibacter sp. TaxID=1960295 RepID=UPI003158512E